MSDREIIRKQRAQRAYRCDSHGGMIKSGAWYLRFSVPPQDDQKRWSVTRECTMCATMHGRAGLLEEK